MCCNGVLFADVRLRPGDDPVRLAALGIPLKKRGDLKRFQQPCVCLEGNRCRIYADRPERCRTFECRLLQRAQAGEISSANALKSIREARRQADGVRQILRDLGDTDETVPLSRRYEKMMRQPVDLSAGRRLVNLHGKLMTAYAELMTVLGREFIN